MPHRRGLVGGCIGCGAVDGILLGSAVGASVNAALPAEARPFQLAIRRLPASQSRPRHGKLTRDAFLGLAKTCQKLCISFWDYLGAKLGVPDTPTVPPLPDLIRCRGQPT